MLWSQTGMVWDKKEYRTALWHCSAAALDNSIGTKTKTQINTDNSSLSWHEIGSRVSRVRCWTFCLCEIFAAFLSRELFPVPEILGSSHFHFRKRFLCWFWRTKLVESPSLSAATSFGKFSFGFSVPEKFCRDFLNHRFFWK